MSGFQDQTVIITGATRGIGKGLTKAFLESGATVIGTYVGNDEAAKALQEDLNTDKLILKKFDISNYEAVEAFYAEIEKEHPVIDVLINNGGIRKDSVSAMMPAEDWDSVININLNGCFYMSKCAIKNMMRQRYGRIVHMCSPMSRLGFAGQSNYAASKAGQEGMTKSMSKEVASRGITVNCLSPGFIATELIDDLSPEQVKEYKKMVPARRFGTVEEVAHAAMFLASKESAYINGTTLEVGGGI